MVPRKRIQKRKAIESAMYHERPKMIETHSATAPMLRKHDQRLYQHHLHTGKTGRGRGRSHVK